MKKCIVMHTVLSYNPYKSTDTVNVMYIQYVHVTELPAIPFLEEWYMFFLAANIVSTPHTPLFSWKLCIKASKYNVFIFLPWKIPSFWFWKVGRCSMLLYVRQLEREYYFSTVLPFTCTYNVKIIVSSFKIYKQDSTDSSIQLWMLEITVTVLWQC